MTTGLSPEVAAEDPAPSAPRGARRVTGLVYQLLVLWLATATMGSWLVYGLLRLFLPRPPVVPSPARVRRIAGLLWRDPGLDAIERAWYLAHLARTMVLAPLHGVAWMIDEIVYRRQLAAHPVEQPLFEISAWRSGSTRLAHLLHDDPGLAAPMLLQEFLPYLWVWRLARLVPGGRRRDEAVARWMQGMFPPEFTARHEFDPWRTDTYEVHFLTSQLSPYTFTLRPEVVHEEFCHRGTAPTRALWDDDFLRMVDGLGRRVLAFAGPAPGGGPRRFFLKGHFLAAAPNLAERYPGARFVTVVRDPAARLQSTLNYLRSMPDFFGLGPLPWRAIVRTVPAELEYDHAELAWYTRDDGVRRCVVPFDEFVGDLPGALRRIYRECLDADGPPPSVRLEHERRPRAYTVDHGLDALGVDVAALDAQMVAYRAWCRPADPSRMPKESTFSSTGPPGRLTKGSAS